MYLKQEIKCAKAFCLGQLAEEWREKSTTMLKSYDNRLFFFLKVESVEIWFLSKLEVTISKSLQRYGFSITNRMIEWYVWNRGTNSDMQQWLKGKQKERWSVRSTLENEYQNKEYRVFEDCLNKWLPLRQTPKRHFFIEFNTNLHLDFNWFQKRGIFYS